MSTNYYIYKENRLPTEDLIHIGKAVFKKPKGLFIWAISPENFGKMGDVIVIDEYGKRCSASCFTEFIKNREWNLDNIGIHFS